MAKQKGFIKLKGSLGGLTFYESDGKSVVRTTEGVDKERIERDPAFRRTRENMSEFGGAAKVGKAFRMGFSNIIKSMSDSTIVARLTGIMKRINSVGPGNRGQRSFLIFPNKELLEGFEFNKQAPLASIFYAPYDAPTFDANRSIVTWTVPAFNPDQYLTVPEGATHFKLVLSVAALSDYHYNLTNGSFEPENPDENEMSAYAISDSVSLSLLSGTPITLTGDTGYMGTYPPSVAVLAATGIIFYQEINGDLYELASDNAMRVEVVG